MENTKTLSQGFHFQGLKRVKRKRKSLKTNKSKLSFSKTGTDSGSFLYKALCILMLGLFLFLLIVLHVKTSSFEGSSINSLFKLTNKDATLLEPATFGLETDNLTESVAYLEE